MTNEERARNSLAAFVRAVGRIANQKFQLIVGAGDSGQIMVWVTKAVYDELGITFPRSIVFPTYRHSDEAETVEFNNKYFLDQARKQVPDMTDIQNILFVDDEIGSGLVAKGIVDLFEAAGSNDGRKYTVLAEDGGFDTKAISPGINVDFIPTKKREKDVYNILPSLVPEKVSSMIENELSETVECYTGKIDMTVLLGLPVKEFNNGKPEFTTKYLERANQNIRDLTKEQQEFRKFLTGLIRTYLT